MRHFRQAFTVTPRTRRMIEAANPASLVAGSCCPHGDGAGLPCAFAVAIDLATIAIAADQYLDAARRAQVQTSRNFHRPIPSRRQKIDRKIDFVEQSSCTCAHAHCGARHRGNLAVLAGVVPVLLGSDRFTLFGSRCHLPIPLRFQPSSPQTAIPLSRLQSSKTD